MMLAFNIGSGQRPFTTIPEVIRWVNVDSVERPNQKADLICDGANLPCLSGSVDYVVLHHVLEHFGCNEGIGLIEEAHRILKPGGSLLVFVPDLRMLAARWLQDELSTQIYMTNLYGAYMGDGADRHKWGFDRDALWEFLSRATQWSEVRLFDWRDVPGADIAQDWWIAGMECVR